MIVPMPCVTDLVLPPDDGVICRAIDELRTKIALWSRAAVEIEGQLGDRTAQPHEEPIQRAGDVDDLAQRQAESEDTTDVAPPETLAEETISEPESEAEIEARLETVDPTVANTVRRKRQEEACDEPIGSLIEACDLELQDDDDLLASLAPEMAEAIRVEHRLFNGRRSIRELIEARRDNPVESREKRRWWRRGKR